MFPQEIIRKKRDKGVLSADEISFFIKGITDNSIADCQASALTMAAFLNGLNKAETVALTLAMRDSGKVLKWHVNGPVIDKHSTGGVGDKVSLMLAPILACCGGYVPMIAGKGLGHTGGTIDKLDSIKGYQTATAIDRFQKVVKEVGCAIIGQTADLAPADKKLYALRDVCGTVESIPLITASILSKKLAAGLEYLVMDLKCGAGAFMPDLKNARQLAKTIMETANDAGTKTTAIITDMNEVLGTTVGNALEVSEALLYLKGEKPNPRLDEVTFALAENLLLSAHLCQTEKEAESKIKQALASGAALEKFGQMVHALGGASDFTDKPEKYLPRAKIIRPVFAPSEGYVEKMDVRGVGLLLVGLKGGRTHPDQKLDYATGLTSVIQIGDKVDNQTPLAYIHAQTEEQFATTVKSLQKLITIGSKKHQSKVILS